jgi:hypothetical protein
LRAFAAVFLLSLSAPAVAQPYAPSGVLTQACLGSTVPVIGTGGVAMTVLNPAQAQHGWMIVNVDTTEPLWVSFAGAAHAGGGQAANSFPLPPGAASTWAGVGSFVTPSGFGTNGAVSIVAATTGHKFACYYW